MTVERIVSRILLAGGVLGIVLMLAGLTGYALRVGANGEALSPASLTAARPAAGAAHVFRSAPEIVDGLRQTPVDPLAMAALGVVILLSTPVAAVAASIPAFMREGDRRFAAIAVILASVLVASLLVGGG